MCGRRFRLILFSALTSFSFLQSFFRQPIDMALYITIAKLHAHPNITAIGQRYRPTFIFPIFSAHCLLGHWCIVDCLSEQYFYAHLVKTFPNKVVRQAKSSIVIARLRLQKDQKEPTLEIIACNCWKSSRFYAISSLEPYSRASKSSWSKWAFRRNIIAGLSGLSSPFKIQKREGRARLVHSSVCGNRRVISPIGFCTVRSSIV